MKFVQWALVGAVLGAIWLRGIPESSAQGLLPPGDRSPISSEAGVVNESAVVLQELATIAAERIPERLLADAHGIAIVPHFMRGAFVVGVGGGRGVLLTKDPAGNWMAPEFITMGGGSFGWQVGVQSTDLVLVFRSPRSLNNIRQGKLTLGVDASAAAGPVGRYTSAATDARLQAEILTYSRSRGLFAGVSLGGSVLQMDVTATQRYYQISPTSAGVVPPSAVALVNELMQYTTAIQSAQTAIDRTAAPVPSSLGGLQNSATISVDPRATKLTQAVIALQVRVDDQWKQYLALPGDWLSGKQLTEADVHPVMIRYERVETNPQFDALRVLPEFQHAIGEVRALAKEVSGTELPLALPPPPSGDTRFSN